MEFEDDKLKRILKDSRLEMPFSDFETNMMERIRLYEKEKANAAKSHYYAILTFLLGTVLGTILNYMLTRNLDWISSSTVIQDKIYLVSQVIYVLLIVLFSDRIWKLIQYKKNLPKDAS